MSVNKIILIGNIGQDPDIKQNSSGDPIVNISVATSESWKDKDGERQTKTEWHRVVLFGTAAKFCANYAVKGSKVWIEGKLQTRKWTDKQGIDKWTTEIIVQNFGGSFQILDGRKAGDTVKLSVDNVSQGKSCDEIADENFPNEDVPF